MQELCNNLIETYEDQLIAVILFGSQARGDATPDSDFDVLIILKDLVQATKEIEKIGFFLSSNPYSSVSSASLWYVFDTLRERYSVTLA
ncbi:nucleotidyltransferase domain-containing protein [Cronbergia sp. UHCC 0137]|uniref:nucleotidyltransferase domain-containing protein n=1 Tax=Cronbergia sp. UHCC 0137 TaxID=3110239 RepID=UPI002B2063D3|nr:nucleotidyltransferase domain-containing protein [Cronbergia sp. UHCC 0137]MEA5618945.1 nucleotidyltransferase domain-containing protein [Cronbergia sp. UHCC 0137]